MSIKVLRDYSIFILAIMTFLSSCQLTTTGEKKSVLDEDLSTEEKEQSLEKDIAVEELKKTRDQKDFVFTETEPTIEKQYPNKRNLVRICPQLKKLKMKKES